MTKVAPPLTTVRCRDNPAEGAELTDSEPSLSGPLGPITRAFLRTVWKRLFSDERSNPIYLPRIIKDGYPDWGLPSYDPAWPSGISEPSPMQGVPQDVADSACTADYPISPIATSVPTLTLMNVMFSNLSVMNPVDLTFSDTDPDLTATVKVGTTDRRFKLTAAEVKAQNFFFQVNCCEPRDLDSRVCTEERWTVDAGGQFTACAHDAVISATLRVNLHGDQPATVTVLAIEVTADPSKVEVEFVIDNAVEWAKGMAEIAVNEGIADGSVVRSLEVFLNSPEVKGHLETLINKELARGGLVDPRT